MHYDKPPLSLTQQVALLKQRGLLIENTRKAENYLRDIGYYHFPINLILRQLGCGSQHKHASHATMPPWTNTYTKVIMSLVSCITLSVRVNTDVTS